MDKKHIPFFCLILIIAMLTFWLFNLTRKYERIKFENGNMEYYYRHTIDSISASRKQLEYINDSLLKISIQKQINIVNLESKLDAKDKIRKNEENKVINFTPFTRSAYLDSVLRSEHLR